MFLSAEAGSQSVNKPARRKKKSVMLNFPQQVVETTPFPEVLSTSISIPTATSVAPHPLQQPEKGAGGGGLITSNSSNNYNVSSSHKKEKAPGRGG